MLIGDDQEIKNEPRVAKSSESTCKITLKCSEADVQVSVWVQQGVGSSYR